MYRCSGPGVYCVSKHVKCMSTGASAVSSVPLASTIARSGGGTLSEM